MAWDGKTLAADRRAVTGSTRTVLTKVRRGRDGTLVGVAGTAALIEGIFEWLLDGRPRPEGQEDKQDCCCVIEITPEGRCYKHERIGRFLVEAPFFAIGTGADFALAAMSLGHGAAAAVEVAARFDVGTGDGVDALPLDGPRRRAPPRRKAKATRR